MSQQSRSPDIPELERLTTDPHLAGSTHDDHKKAEKPKRTRRIRQYHWKTPTVMGISLLAGLVLALAHHFFYEHWHGRVVQSDTEQKWVVRAGTAFAFCFKASLAVGAGIAFVQHMWLCLQSMPHKIRHVDSMFTILSSAPQFLNFALWARRPVLLVMALITWLLPLAAIIAPGTLIVTSIPHTTFLSQIVPRLDLQNKPDAYGLFQAVLPFLRFMNPTSDLFRLSLASASSSSILPITPPQPNCSYALDFFAPAISCSPAPDSAATSFKNQLNNYTDNSMFINYFSWTPDSEHLYIDTPIPFNTTVFEPYDYEYGLDRPPMLFVWAGPDNATYLHTGALIGCTLKNVSYTVNFRFEGTQQILDVKRGDNLVELIPAHIIDLESGNFTETAETAIIAEWNSTIPYQSIMWAFGEIMTGAVSIGLTDPAGGAATTPTSTLVQSTGLYPLLYSADNATLAGAIEELFQNITFSLFSNQEFLVDPLSTSVAPTNVTVTNPQNIYTYQSLDLLLSYGIAILVAVVSLSIGCLAIVRNGLSYSNEFSTILRTTRSEDLDSLIQDEETGGGDPLPAHIGDIEVRHEPFTNSGRAGFQRWGRGMTRT